jgi:hypothetical protein
MLCGVMQAGKEEISGHERHDSSSSAMQDNILRYVIDSTNIVGGDTHGFTKHHTI